MRSLTFLFLLMFIFASLCLVSVPQIVSADEGYSSHTHPHPPRQHCMKCGKYDVPGQHYCPKAEREKQEQEVVNSNLKANNERLEDKVDDNADKDLGDFIWDKAKSYLSDAGDAAVKVGEWVTGKEGSVKCPGGCGDWVSDEKEHWGTGTCAIGHVHWTCAPGAKEHHAGCYWVDEPDTNPDKQYEGAKYSVSCESCGETRWTNDYDTYMSWQSNTYCSDCSYKYGY